MFYAVLWLAPERDFAAIAMTNVSVDGTAAACDEAIARLIQGFLGMAE